MNHDSRKTSSPEGARSHNLDFVKSLACFETQPTLPRDHKPDYFWSLPSAEGESGGANTHRLAPPPTHTLTPLTLRMFSNGPAQITPHWNENILAHVSQIDAYLRICE
jgi:hypothetical protein